MNIRKISLVILLFTLCSCGGRKNKDTDSDLTRTAYVPERNLVDTIILRPRTFYKEVVSNGRLRAVKKSNLQFLRGGELEAIFAKNGEYVAAGREIARLNSYETSQRLSQSELQLQRSYMDLLDIIIGWGFPADTNAVPKDRLQIAYVRSGYLTARSNLGLTKNDQTNLVLKTPFGGKVANLNKKVYDYTNASEIFCTLIDDTLFEVDFNLLESEVPFVRIGQTLRVSPFNYSDQSFSGKITQINPVVDNNGQINLRAEVSNRDGMLMEGMNVKVTIEDAIEGQLVVPKTAALIRDNLEVLFRFGPDGRAMWTYINILMSNSTSHVVTANVDRGGDLNVGDIIITAGNLNLAHGSTVEVRP